LPTYRVDVNPNVLKWARKRAGFSIEDAAAKLRIDSLALRYWEEGADELSQPTLVQLREMARHYGLPLAALYLPEPPEIEPEGLPDFRTMRSDNDREWSPELRATYRRVLMQQEVAADIARAAGELPAPIALTLSFQEEPELAGKQVREWLGVTIGEQFAWRSDYQALNTWVNSIESRGILVAQSRGVSIQEMRGFSISNQPFPAIVLNGSDTPRGKIFTLIHELVHILVHAGGLCNLVEPDTHNRDRDITETFCNQVAGAVLLPYRQLAGDLNELGKFEPTIWPDAILAQLANRYHVSREVVIRRLVSLRRATLDFYYQKLRQYAGQYERNRELEPRPRTGGPDSAVLKLRDIGRLYASEVLRAYARRDIDAAELSEYLGVKVEQIPKITSLLSAVRE
jgi:Zn-dependent peptidase ImmA (M78 family)